MKPPAAPAFQCYPDDLLAGTSEMTAEEFGVYWRLLCHSWNKDGLPNDDQRLALMAGQCSGSAVAYAKTKFYVAEDGRLRNARQEQVRKEQAEYRRKQSENAHLRWDRKKHHSNAIADAVALPVDMPKRCSPPPPPSPSNRERAAHFPEAIVPTWDEVKTMADIQGVEESVARGFFEHYDSKNLWANKHGSPVNVRGCLTVWNNNQKKINASNRTNGKSRNEGTYNAEIASDGYSKLVQ